jgi:hypothetical protein
VQKNAHHAAAYRNIFWIAVGALMKQIWKVEEGGKLAD